MCRAVRDCCIVNRGDNPFDIRCELPEDRLRNIGHEDERGTIAVPKRTENFDAQRLRLFKRHSLNAFIPHAVGVV